MGDEDEYNRPIDIEIDDRFSLSEKFIDAGLKILYGFWRKKVNVGCIFLFWLRDVHSKLMEIFLHEYDTLAVSFPMSVRLIGFFQELEILYTLQLTIPSI